ncbi:hypothetical protein Tco_1371079 [Tanacetum coccineum]
MPFLSVIELSQKKDDPLVGSTTTHSEIPSPIFSGLAEENFKTSNPLFEFDDKFKSSTINPLFDEMEEYVEIKNSNVSDEPVLLNTPLSDKVELVYPERQ